MSGQPQLYTTPEPAVEQTSTELLAASTEQLEAASAKARRWLTAMLCPKVLKQFGYSPDNEQQGPVARHP